MGGLTWGRVWELAQPALNFSTPKSIVLQDWRLGGLLRALQVAIVVFVLWDIIYKQSFLLNETPLGIVEPIATGRYLDDNANTEDIYKVAQDKFYNESQGKRSFKYCNNSAYSFQVSDTLDWSNIGCVYKDKAEISTRSGSGMLVTTFFESKRVDAVSATSAGACAALCPGGESSFRIGRCYCNRDNYFFTVGAESLVVSFNHAFYATCPGCEGNLPQTRIRRSGSDEDLKVIRAGNKVSFTVAEWLNFVNVDLDKSVNQSRQTLISPGVGYSAGKLPLVRLTGVQLLMKLQYYNYRQWPGSTKKINNVDAPTECILTIEAKFLGSSTGYSVNYVYEPGFGYPNYSGANRTASYVNDIGYGVLFNFQASGLYGSFQYSKLIQAFVSGLVLLKAAQTVVTLVALYLMGLRSRLYKSQLKEAVSFEREYARFAAQAMAAHQVFKAIDTDSSGTLDTQNLFRHLRQIDDRLSDAQVNLLVDLLLKKVDSKGEEEVGEDGKVKHKGDGKLSLQEYLAVFTDDKVSVDDLLLMTYQLKSSEEEKKRRAEEKKLKQEAKEARRRKKAARGSDDDDDSIDGPRKALGSPDSVINIPDKDK